MLRDEPTIRPGLFRMPEKPIGPRILIPAFRQAKMVHGAFGWFSGGWIARLAPGLAIYLNRDDVAPMRFTVAPTLYPREMDVVSRSLSLSEEEANSRILSLFVDGKISADSLARHALDCMAWMIATGRLVLRVAVPYCESNYHPKVWLFDDGEEQVLVRGSGNATSKGVHSGVEHMDVDISWDKLSSERIRDGRSMLDDWAAGKSLGIKSVHELSEAVEKEIISIAPADPPGLEDYLEACAREGNPIYAILPSMRMSFVKEKSRDTRLRIPEHVNWHDPPYGHQAEAVSAWESSGKSTGKGKPEHGVLAMATGSGKTIAALICATRAQNRRLDRPFLVVVSAPSSPLLLQWQDEIQRFGVSPTVPTLNSRGTTFALTQACRRLLGGSTEILVVTNHLLCTPEFQRALEEASSEAGATTMIVADEAHTLGAQGFISNKPEFFELRLGLSATPERQYDPDGTEAIFSFFGETVYEFGLAKAIGFCLVPYSYHVHATMLSGEEFDEFVVLSGKVGAMLGQGVTYDDETLTRLLIHRRRIVETAAAKIELFRNVLQKRGPHTIHHALVYASSKNPEQFKKLKTVLDELGIIYAEVTEKQTSNDKLLSSVFREFERGEIRLLLAKKVLDEGIDLPSIREAFLVASSTIEREWVQRRGRILRKQDGKTHAVMHDFLAVPSLQGIDEQQRRGVRSVVANELGRATTFAKYAQNAAGERGVVAHISEIRKAYWSQGDYQEPILNLSHPYILAPDTPTGRIE